MQLNRVRRKVPPTNLTPLIDVVFLLLIFFMLASTFLKFSGTPVSGASSGGVSTNVNELALIQIRGEDGVTVNGRTVTTAELTDVLAELSGKGVTRGVVRPLPAATVQDLVDVLEIARSSTLESIVVVR